MPSAGSRVLRGVLVLLGLAVAAGSAAVAWLRWGPPQADLRQVARQNVLLVTIDTLRADALGVYGGPARTPVLDALAHDGVRFDFAHAHAVRTLPSHASILTGRYPFQHGVRDNAGYRLSPRSQTAASLLKAAGYETAAFLGGFPVHARFGLNQGFDVYDDTFGDTQDPAELVMPGRPATAVVPLAQQWIAGRTGSWFVWIHVFDPHAPYTPPTPLDREYSGRPYYGEVAAVDRALAPLVDTLRASEHPTFVVVTSDHGEALGDHGEATHGVFAYESTLRVPLVMAEIGGAGGSDKRISRGDWWTLIHDRSWREVRDESWRRAKIWLRHVGPEVSHTPARHVDILPTVLDAIGQPVPPDVPGRTLLAAGARRAASAPPSYFESMSPLLTRGWAPLQGGIVGRDKYIDLPIPERYDLSSDPGEQTNLLGQFPDRDRALTSAFAAFHAAPPGSRDDAGGAARVRALEYISGSASTRTTYTDADDPKTLIGLDGDLHRAMALYAAKHVDAAIDAYTRLIAERPGMPIAYRHLAFIQQQSGDQPAAIATLRQGLAAGAATTDLVVQLARYLGDSDGADEAIRLLEPLAVIDPPDVETVTALGIAYERDGRDQDAHAIFERVLRMDPTSEPAVENLGALDIAHGDYDSAERRYQRAAELDPRSSSAQAGLGVVALNRGDHDAAIAAWRRAVELDAANYDALYNLGMTLARDGRVEEARPALEQFVQTAPPANYERDIKDVSALLRNSATPSRP